MRGWAVTGVGGAPGRLAEVEREVPDLAPDEVLVAVRTCGVCRTDLHLAEGDLPPRAPRRIPGHEAVGTVVGRGDAARRFEPGERVGIAWLRSTCGRCRQCRRGQENLCPASCYTGWDSDGGFAEYAAVPEAYAYPVPGPFSDVEAAPLLCSGIIGYRALTRAALPPGGRLGIYGFGASAHLTLQLAVRQGSEVYVMTRDPAARRLALELGAAWVGGATDAAPVPLDSAILFAPVGDLVPVALQALDDAGTLAVAGIYLTDVPRLDYQRHLFRERVLTSVTANTRRDGEAFLRLAAALDLRPHVTTYALANADRALDDLAAGRFSGAAVLAAG
jgi:propanol-preferring alcohol dehydrogenase